MIGAVRIRDGAPPTVPPLTFFSAPLSRIFPPFPVGTGTTRNASLSYSVQPGALEIGQPVRVGLRFLGNSDATTLGFDASAVCETTFVLVTTTTTVSLDLGCGAEVAAGKLAQRERRGVGGGLGVEGRARDSHTTFYRPPVAL